MLNEVVRVASNFLGNVAGGTLNLGSTARENRDKSFAEFLRGVSLGYIAMFYDSSAVVTAAMSGTDPGKLIDYKSVMDSAYAALAAVDRPGESAGHGLERVPAAGRLDSDADDDVVGGVREAGSVVSGALPREHCAHAG